MHPRSLRPFALALAVATLGAGALTGCGSPANEKDTPSATPTTLDTDHTVNGGNAAQGTKKG